MTRRRAATFVLPRALGEWWGLAGAMLVSLGIVLLVAAPGQFGGLFIRAVSNVTGAPLWL